MIKYCNRTNENYEILKKLGYILPIELNSLDGLEKYPFYEIREEELCYYKEFVVMGNPGADDIFVSDKEMKEL